MTRQPNVVIIILDAMRRDHLGAYGGQSSSPALDSFCADAVVFPECIAPAPWTVPSHASLFLGKYPSEHGVHETDELKVRETLGMFANAEGESLAEELHRDGYQTVGMPGNYVITAQKGFDRGFRSFVPTQRRLLSQEDLATIRRVFETGKSKYRIAWDLVSRGKLGDLARLYFVSKRLKETRRLTDYPRSKGGNIIVETAREWKFERPFFLFVNLLEMHDPYTQYEQQPSNRGPFPSVQSADIYGFKTIPDGVMDEIRAGYSRAVTTVDRYFGELMDVLKAKGLYDDSLIIVTSDHGQALKEHGYYGHGTFLYDEILEIPLIMKYPRGSKHDVKKGYQSLVGVRSLVQAVRQGAVSEDLLTKETVYSESFGSHRTTPLNLSKEVSDRIESARGRIERPRRAIYKEGLKLVVDWTDKSVEEFTLNGKPLDPQAERKKADDLLMELLEFERTHPTATATTSVLSGEEEALLTDRLRSLGYA